MREAQLDEALVRRLHRRANADRWALSLDRFASALESSVARAFTSEPPREDQVERYLASLHLEDLALACACAEGHEGAWEQFVREQRPVLYRAADAIDRTGGARDLADALYAELFGLTERDGERLSLFRYFHGRSSLATWLRAVLAQRHVDRVRGARRLDPLPAEDDVDAIPAKVDSLDPERARFLRLMRRAVTAAVARLAPRDRLRLACYYAQGLTLAQIGRGLGEHEATSSRHLARTRRAIRAEVERQLRQDEGMSQAEVAECFSSVVEDAGPLDLAEMLRREPARKEFESDRST
jgi:RNA polymerase sigma-70 factor (ECF subfamily)